MTKSKAGNLTHNLATLADLVEFYGCPPEQSVKAIVFRDGGKLVAIGGVKREGGRWVAFSEIKPDANLSKMTIWRGAKVVMEMIKAMNMPIWAVAERKGESTGKFSMRLGFVHEAANQYGEVYCLWPN